MSENPSLSQKYENINNKLIVLTQDLARMEERLNIFVEKTKNIEEKFDQCPVKCAYSDTISRIKILELHEEIIQELENDIQELKSGNYTRDLNQQSLKETIMRTENKWKIIGWVALNIIVPIVWVTIASFLLYYLGVTSPPIP